MKCGHVSALHVHTSACFANPLPSFGNDNKLFLKNYYEILYYNHNFYSKQCIVFLIAKRNKL